MYDRKTTLSYWLASKTFNQSELRYVNFPIRDCITLHEIGQVVVAYPPSMSLPILFEVVRSKKREGELKKSGRVLKYRNEL